VTEFEAASEGPDRDMIGVDHSSLHHSATFAASFTELARIPDAVLR
jgi:hypothetical protein